jgi:hypothetical protein
MMRAKLPVLAVFLASIPFAAADRKPVRPAPPPVNLTVAPGSDARLGQVVRTHAGDLIACASRSLIKVKLRASFDHGGRARQIIVRSDGGRAFERCVAKALRGERSARRGVSGPRDVAFVIDAAPGMPAPKPVPVPAPKPVPAPAPPPKPGKLDVQACKVDSDCTVHFRVHACFPGNPIGVNKLDPAAVRAAFPVERHACGMGGPQYDRQRMANEGRYTAACQASRCAVVDHGLRPTIFDGI